MTTYIYGIAANNMHGDLNDAVMSGTINENEKSFYENVSIRIMSGRMLSEKQSESIDWYEKIQSKLDDFFYKDEIAYEEFEKRARVVTGERFAFMDDGSAVEIKMDS